MAAALALMLAFAFTAVPDASDDVGGDDAVLNAPDADYTFTISGSGPSSFTAFGMPGSISISTGSIQQVIDAIDTGRETAVKKLQFATINLGTAYATLSKGTYIVDGTVTSAALGTLKLTDGATVFVVGGEVKNTNSGAGSAIFSDSTGAINVSGGRVEATGSSGCAINNESSGPINISGTAFVTSVCISPYFGTIYMADAYPSISGSLTMSGGTVQNTAAEGIAIRNNTTSAVNISGGTVSATTGVAIYNEDWGVITISGTSTSITSANEGAFKGTIFLNDSGSDTEARLIIEGGTINNTSSSANARAINNSSLGAVDISGGSIGMTGAGDVILNFNSGALNISGGIVSMTGGGNAIRSMGPVSVSGGKVSATTGTAIHNFHTHTFDISGGEVSATTGVAIYNAGAGVIAISGTATVTSENASNASGTIYLADYSSLDNVRLTIEGGTVSNTGTGGNPNVIRNDSKGDVEISGGTVMVTALYTRGVYNNSTGAVNVSGGTVGASISNISTGTVNVSGGKVTSANSVISNTGAGIVNVYGGEVCGVGTNGIGIYNATTGAVNISGGTVSAEDCRAIYNGSIGVITISGTATVTSADTGINHGTIFLRDDGMSTAARLIIEGGKVENTADNNLSTAIRNDSRGAVNIYAGTVSTKDGTAIWNNSVGAVNISAGTVCATGDGTAIWNKAAGTVTVSGGAVSAKTYYAICNQASGAIYVSDGVVSAADGTAIQNESTGPVNISGGTVYATTGRAIYNNNTGAVAISEADPGKPTLVTSENTSDTSGTIHLANPGGTLSITGGVAANTAGGNIIYPFSSNVTITVFPADLVKSANVSKAFDNVTSGLSVTFNNQGVIKGVQWYRDDVAVTGATSTMLDVKNVADSGEYEMAIVYMKADGTFDEIGSGKIGVSITPRTVTVTANNVSKVVGAADPALTYTATGLLGGDTLTGSLVREAGEDAGVYAITQGTLAANGNYAIAFTGANLTIKEAGGGGGISMILIVGIVAVIAVAGFAAYWFLLRKKP